MVQEAVHTGLKETPSESMDQKSNDCVHLPLGSKYLDIFFSTIIESLVI